MHRDDRLAVTTANDDMRAVLTQFDATESTQHSKQLLPGHNYCLADRQLSDKHLDVRGNFIPLSPPGPTVPTVPYPQTASWARLAPNAGTGRFVDRRTGLSGANYEADLSSSDASAPIEGMTETGHSRSGNGRPAETQIAPIPDAVAPRTSRS